MGHRLECRIALFGYIEKHKQRSCGFYSRFCKFSIHSNAYLSLCTIIAHYICTFNVFLSGTRSLSMHARCSHIIYQNAFSTLGNCSRYNLTKTLHCFSAIEMQNIYKLNFIMRSSSLQGEHGISKEVYLSLPCVLTSNGVSHIVRQILTDSETTQLQKSAELMHQVQIGLKF